MTLEQIIYLRHQRQGLIKPVDGDAYEALFRLMSPVPTKFWIEPGSPPEIEHRCDFDDYECNALARRMRTLVKGRFQGGNVGYVYLEELPLFASAYRKPIKAYTEVEEIILTTLRNEGPMNLAMMKEITGIKNKDLAKGAQHLQKAFIVFEDQVDNENDRAWFLLEDEFEALDFSTYSQIEAIKECIIRFLYLNVMGDAMMVKSFTKFTNKIIKKCLDDLVEEGSIRVVTVDQREGYVLKGDVDKIEAVTERVQDQLYLLDNNDYLVKSNELALKKRFGKSDYRTLAYIYKEGKFIGRLLGYFRFKADDLEDIELDVDNLLIEEWKEAIISLIKKAYDGQGNYLKRYQGIELERK